MCLILESLRYPIHHSVFFVYVPVKLEWSQHQPPWVYRIYGLYMFKEAKATCYEYVIFIIFMFNQQIKKAHNIVFSLEFGAQNKPGDRRLAAWNLVWYWVADIGWYMRTSTKDALPQNLQIKCRWWMAECFQGNVWTNTRVYYHFLSMLKWERGKANRHTHTDIIPVLVIYFNNNQNYVMSK